MIDKIKPGGSSTDFKVKTVLSVDLFHPINPAGGKVVACDLDDACMQIDCGPFSQEIEQALKISREGADYVMHYCGIEFLPGDGETGQKK